MKIKHLLVSVLLLLTAFSFIRLTHTPNIETTNAAPSTVRDISPPIISAPEADDPDPPAAPVKLIFIHHSCGENWLNDSDGGLGIALRDNNYFVSDTNYEWGEPCPDCVGGDPSYIGSCTDIGHWWEWFRGAHSITYTQDLYTEYGQHASYSRLATDPGGENAVVMFKSCYPNSHLGGNPSDPPAMGDNPLRGHDAYDDTVHTVANAKGIYNDILVYFATRQDKLFVVITAPPLMDSETDASHAANARAFNDWLVNDWLDGYAHDNVAVFDFYNVLTSNGGDSRIDDPDTNDAGRADGNHHRWVTASIQHTQTISHDYSAYWGGNGGGSHPTAAGNQKATTEFVPLLNVYYHRWHGSAPPAPTLTLSAPNGGESWTEGSSQEIRWTSSGSISDVSLAYSTDGFATAPVTITASTANDGSYDWTVPDDPSTTVRVRVASTVSPTTVYDDSDADFAIVSSSEVETYTFRAVITPTHATAPVTYQWTPAPASGQGTAYATYHWPPGTYDLTLAATNCGGTVTDQRSVTVGGAVVAARGEARVARGEARTARGEARTARGDTQTQQSMSFTSVRDAILANDAHDNANLGGAENLETYYSDVESRRSLMRWDLTGLPAGITVNGATVELYHYDGGGDNPAQVTLHRVTREWDEGTGNNFWPDPSYAPDGATWLTATAGVAWTTPGGDYDATALDQKTLPSTTGATWVRLDATAAVQAWVGGSTPNYGLLLRPQSGEWSFHYYHSREAVTSTLRPRLLVTYTTGGPAPALDITAPASGTHWPVSSTQQIAWNTTGVVTQVNLYYSLGDGLVPIASHVANTSASNSYPWTTPPTATTSAQVRVESVISPTQVYAVSDAFTLYATGSPSATLHLPLVLKGYAAAQLCPHPLTGVAIVGPTTGTPSSGDLLQPSDLVYQGAFAYPSGDEWAYSGQALAYYPDGDPSGPDDGAPGSLYAAGHAHHDLVGEISIPTPVIAGSFDDLPQASVLRALTDISGGWKDNCTYDEECQYREVDGLAYIPGIDKVIWNLRDWYNATGCDQDSLGWSDRDMSGAQGVWHIGARPSADDVFHNAKACNYLFDAPQSFAEAHLEGKWLIAGNHREAGALGGSQGPTLYALAPWEDGNPPASGQNLDALALLYYATVNECVWEAEGDINERPAPGVCHFPDYRAMDHWGGGAWVQSAAKRGILIVGRKGLGDNCYGSTETCGADPCAPSSGYHAYPYTAQMLFYDPEALKEVLDGSKAPWEVLPYAVHSPTDEIFEPECAILGAAAHDRERGLIYVTEQEAGPSGETVVHVWQVP